MDENPAQPAIDLEDAILKAFDVGKLCFESVTHETAGRFRVERFSGKSLAAFAAAAHEEEALLFALGTASDLFIHVVLGAQKFIVLALLARPFRVLGYRLLKLLSCNPP